MLLTRFLHLSRSCNFAFPDAADVIFVLDGSGSVGLFNFRNYMIPFVNAVIGRLPLSPSRYQVGNLPFIIFYRNFFHNPYLPRLTFSLPQGFRHDLWKRRFHWNWFERFLCDVSASACRHFPPLPRWKYEHFRRSFGAKMCHKMLVKSGLKILCLFCSFATCSDWVLSKYGFR